jgi:site-specific DNA-cytosine methylase
MAIKLLIGGSPCTHWSIAQKNNRETKPEGLGWELFKNYLIAKEKFKPDFFLYENNKSASQAIKDQIAQELSVGTDPDARFTYINSALVSAQNRQRFYVTNFGDIEQPKDRGILLKDILETGCPRYEKAHCIDANYYKGGNASSFNKQSGQRMQALEPVRIPEYGPDKARPLNAYYSNNCGGFEHRMFSENPNKQQVDMIAESVKVGCLPSPDGTIKDSQAMRIYDMEGKSVTLSAQGGGMGGKTGLYAIPVNTTPEGKSQTIKSQYQKTSPANMLGYTSTYGASGVAEPVNAELLAIETEETMRVKEATKQGYVDISVGDSVDLTQPNSKTRRGRSLKNKSNCLTTSNAMYQYCGVLGYATPIEWDEEGRPTKAVSCADGKVYTVYEVKDGIITIKGKQYPIKLVDGYYIIRKLTVKECCRLQTMPDDYCKAVSDSQAYKGLGNGWTAEVIIHLLNHALKNVPRDEEIIVLSMYDGIGTGRYCLNKMGFTNVKYYAYEIDKYPIAIAKDNYPDIIQCGDAFAVREDDWQSPQTRREWLNELLGGGA